MIFSIYYELGMLKVPKDLHTEPASVKAGMIACRPFPPPVQRITGKMAAARTKWLMGNRQHHDGLRKFSNLPLQDVHCYHNLQEIQSIWKAFTDD